MSLVPSHRRSPRRALSAFSPTKRRPGERVRQVDAGPGLNRSQRSDSSGPCCAHSTDDGLGINL